MNSLIDNVVNILYRIIYEDAYSSIIPINISKNKELNNSQKSYAIRLSYGVIENLILLNHYIDDLANKRIKKKVRIILLLALYEIEFMQDNADHISVNKYVNYAKTNYPYAKNFVNAVLREHLRKGKKRFIPKTFEEKALFYSHPLEIAEIFKNAYGEEEAIKIMQANQSMPNLNLRVNFSKTSPNKLIEALKNEGVEAKTSDKSDRCVIIENLNGMLIKDLKTYRTGDFYVQDIASILLVDALNIQGDEKVLDLCSAPGGKALAIAEDIKRKNGSGTVLACDIFEKKIKKIQENAKRLSLDINCQKNDASLLNTEFIDGFDIVLADVPCSGLGIIRKKPEIKYRKQGQNLKNMIELQGKILDAASEYVKTNGRLIYSTCTINPEENQKQVLNFISKKKNFVLEAINIKKIKSNSYIQLLSSNGYSDGFFISILRKIS